MEYKSQVTVRRAGRNHVLTGRISIRKKSHKVFCRDSGTQQVMITKALGNVSFGLLRIVRNGEDSFRLNDGLFHTTGVVYAYHPDSVGFLERFCVEVLLGELAVLKDMLHLVSVDGLLLQISIG